MQIQGFANANLIKDGGAAKTKEPPKLENGAFEGLLKSEKTDKKKDDNPMKGMIENIDVLKGQLNFDLTVDNLNKYKEAVKSFLQYYTQNEMSMEEHYLKDRRGFVKRVGVIKTVNEKLDELRSVLETNSGHLEALKKIGEIHGLIVNEFM